jgi:threonine 3-dehydrogenase
MATLITGGTGFIGAQVARLLLERGEPDLVLFDLNPGAKRLDDLAGRVSVVRGDLAVFSHVLDAVSRARPASIYHLGGMLSVPSEADPAAAVRVNALGTFHVLEAARLFGVGQVLFSSSIGTYTQDNQSGRIDDYTLQRSPFIYGATKIFGENLGLFYRRKHGLDFRALRYPSVVGPGIGTPGVVQYTSWAIEAAAAGKPFTIWVAPETRVPVIYVKDAARAIVELGAAPRDAIKMVNYVVAGPTPAASAAELVGAIRARTPEAQLDFQPDPALQPFIDQLCLPIDDRKAREEWGWRAHYDQARIVDDFYRELTLHGQRDG